MRAWCFRWRGYLFVPIAVIVLLLARPTLPSYLCGLAVALAGEAIRIWGVGYAGQTTRESAVTAPALVTAGPYAYVKNPLYVGNFVTALGFFVMAAGGLPAIVQAGLLLLVACWYFMVYGLIIPLEEAYLSRTFGEAYRAYSAAVPRVVPRLSPYPERQGRFRWSAIARAEIHTIILLAAVSALMALKIVHPWPW